MKAGLVGFGMAGQFFHGPLLTDAGWDLAYIQTKAPENIAQAQLKYPNAKVVSHIDVILEDPAVDLVVIATPNEAHFPLAKMALDAGKNVVVDKPFTVTVAEAEMLISVAKAKGKVLSVFQNRRWDSDFITVSNILKNNMLGDVFQFNSCYDRYRPQLKSNAWREKPLPGSGILYDLGAHQIDQVLQLFGMPAAVLGDVQKQRPDAQIDDYYELTLYYHTLFTVHISAGMLFAAQRPRFSVYGDKGSYVKYGFDIQEDALKSGGLPSRTKDWGKEKISEDGTITILKNNKLEASAYDTYPGNYSVFYTNVEEVLQGKSSLLVQPEESKNVIKLITLAIESSKQKQIIQVQ